MHFRLSAAVSTLAASAALWSCGGEEVERVDLSSAPAHLAVGEGAVWAGVNDAVVRIDRNGKPTKDEIGVGPTLAGLAVGEGAVWIANAFDNTVVKADPKRLTTVGEREPVGAFELGEAPMVADLGAVWVGVEDSVVRLDRRTGNVTGKPIQVGGSPRSLAVADGLLWVVTPVGAKRAPAESDLNPEDSIVPKGQQSVADPRRDRTIVAIDPRTRRLSGRRLKLDDPRDIAAGMGALWVADGRRLVRLDPSSRRVTQTIPIPAKRLSEVAVGEGSVWVGARLGNKVYRVDPKTREVSDPYEMETTAANDVSAEVGDIAVGLGSAWVGSDVEKALGRIDASGPG